MRGLTIVTREEIAEANISQWGGESCAGMCIRYSRSGLGAEWPKSTGMSASWTIVEMSGDEADPPRTHGPESKSMK
jgi:hypothetical protein